MKRTIAKLVLYAYAALAMLLVMLAVAMLAINAWKGDDTAGMVLLAFAMGLAIVWAVSVLIKEEK